MLLLALVAASPCVAVMVEQEAAGAALSPSATAQEGASQPRARAPLPPPGELARCKALIDAGAYQAARERLEPIVALHPDWARATALLGLTYYKENRFEPARELFARALEANPGEIAVRPFYGWTLYSLGELEEAEAMFRSLVERRPDYAPAYYGLGLVHRDRDEVELAQRQDDRAMEGRARARLGDLHVRLDELEPARRELERAIELFAIDAEAHFKLSRVLFRLGDEEAGRAALERAQELKTDFRAGTQAPE